jgi:hypothetical protein
MTELLEENFEHLRELRAWEKARETIFDGLAAASTHGLLMSAADNRVIRHATADELTRADKWGHLDVDGNDCVIWRKKEGAS